MVGPSIPQTRRHELKVFFSTVRGGTVGDSSTGESTCVKFVIPDEKKKEIRSGNTQRGRLVCTQVVPGL